MGLPPSSNWAPKGKNTWFQPKGKGTKNTYGNKGTQGKGYTDQSDAAWAGRRNYTDPTKNNQKGQQSCRKHHLYGACYGKCGRDHSKCPNKTADGTWCNQNHPAYKCTHHQG